jgi:hypothetical protein
VKNPLHPLKSIWYTARSLVRAFRRQRISIALIVALLLLLLAVVFAFLAFAPVLSPFIYPLF